MVEKSITGIVTWLKNWFFDKEQVLDYLGGKVNVNQGTTESNKLLYVDSGGEVKTIAKSSINIGDFNDDNTPFTPKSHQHGDITNTGAITTNAVTFSNSDMPIIADASNSGKLQKGSVPTDYVKDSIASTYTNIGNLSNGATQKDINTAINNKLGNLDIEIINVVTTLPTASASTMNKLYILVANGGTDVYYTEEDGNSHEWVKLDNALLDDLSIDWADINYKPFDSVDSSWVTNSTNPVESQLVKTALDGKADTNHDHTISTISETGEVGIVLGNNQSPVDLGTHLSNLATIIASKGARSDDIDWEYNTNGFVNGIKLHPKTSSGDDATGTITFHLKDSMGSIDDIGNIGVNCGLSVIGDNLVFDLCNESDD